VTTRGDKDQMLRIASTPVAGEWPELVPRSSLVDVASLHGALRGSAASRLELPDALAVTTGQQPGLFGGPMYVVHKALGARALAAELERRWQRPVVPVFWLAGDDHDWDEATRTAWWTANDEVIDWRLQPRDSGAPQRSMSAEPLPADCAAARDRLADDLPPGEARDATLAWIDRHWKPGATIHGSYTSALTELFEPLGIATFDATHPAVKQAQRPWIDRALRLTDDLDGSLASLPEVESWVGAGQGLSLVFIDAREGRDRLVKVGDRFRTRRSGEEFSINELRTMLDTEPERFSANVLLRPVIEAALLPTVCYVAGPGELRYLTRQAVAVYPHLDVAPQAVVPRWGGAVVDPVTTRLLSRIDSDVQAVMSDNGELGREVLARDLPTGIPAAIARLDAMIDAVSQELSGIGTSIDPVLERAIESRRRRLHFVSEDLSRLMLRHHRKRGDILWSQYRRVRARLMPFDKPQERVIGVAAALGRWGQRWIEAATEAAAEWAAESVDSHTTSEASR
jgi:bacillithiol biosynthesis cysteine-adding enzyme BshC